MRLILLAFENDSYAAGAVARRLLDLGHEVSIVNGDQYCFIHGSEIQGWYKRFGLERVYTLQQEYEQLSSSNPQIDWEFLQSFERRFCVSKNLTQLLLTDHIFNCGHRYPYYTAYTREQMYFWLQLQLRWSEKILRGTRPDLIFTVSNNYLVKNIFFQMATAVGIPMLTLAPSRIDDLMYASQNFCLGTDARTKDAIRQLSEVATPFADSFIAKFTSGSQFTTYSSSWTELRARQFRLSTIAYELFHDWMYSLYHYAFKRRAKLYRGWLRGNLFASSHLLTPIYALRLAWNRLRYLYDPSSPFKKRLPDQDYSYYALHMLPESSTLTQSTEYHEADLIRFLAKELPSGHLLVVKENPTMVGERPFSFYRELQKIPNVHLLDPLFSSRVVLEGSCGVAGISGTVLLEGAIYKKPTLAFGQPEFLDVLDFQGHGSVGDFVRMCQKRQPSSKHKELRAYLEHIGQTGLKIDFTALLYDVGSELFHAGVDTITSLLLSELESVSKPNAQPEIRG
jgi:hypothetical protein